MHVTGKFVVFDNLFHSEEGEPHRKGDRVRVKKSGPESDQTLHRISKGGSRAGEAFRAMIQKEKTL